MQFMFIPKASLYSNNFFNCIINLLIIIMPAKSDKDYITIGAVVSPDTYQYGPYEPKPPKKLD